jgi:hypothetical protein
MISVMITRKSELRGQEEFCEALVEYYTDDAITPAVTTSFVLPVYTDMRALERMLALWGMGDNEEVCRKETPRCKITVSTRRT